MLLKPLLAAKAKESQIATLKRGDSFVCSTCSESFAEQVWHCDKCGHQYSVEDDECGNCHKKKPVLEKSTKRAIDVRESLASLAGVSSNTIHKVETIQRDADPTLLAAVKADPVRESAQGKTRDFVLEKSTEQKSEALHKLRFGEIYKP